MFEKYFKVSGATELEQLERLAGLIRQIKDLRPAFFSINPTAAEKMSEIGGILKEILAKNDSETAGLDLKMPDYRGLDFGDERYTLLHALECLLFKFQVEDLAVKYIATFHWKSLLLRQYNLAVGLITSGPQWPLLAPVEKVRNAIDPHFHGQENVNEDQSDLPRWRYLELCRDEISRLKNDPKHGRVFAKMIATLEERIDNHVRMAASDFFGPQMEMVFLELLPLLVPNGTLSGSSESFDAHYRKFEAPLGKKLENTARMRRHHRMGKKRGGKRSKSEFSWTEEAAIELYKALESIKKVEGEDIWRNVFRKFATMNFDPDLVTGFQLKMEKAGCPRILVKEALSDWMAKPFEKLKPEKKPEAFAIKHALSLMGIRFDKYKLSTLKKKVRLGRNAVIKKEFSK